MAKTLKEISVTVGKYTDKMGQEKSRYKTIGAIVETRNGQMLKLDSIPLVDGGWNGWAYINDPRPKDKYPGLPKDDDLEF